MPESNEYARIACERLGVDPDNLGCVMLSVELPPVYHEAMEKEWLYYSPTLQHVQGIEGDAHVTLLYGLLLSAQTHRDLVDGVLEGWRKPTLFLSGLLEVFGGNDGNEGYSCIVLKPQSSEELVDANARLSKLPHVRGFVDYIPHVTIGYVLKQHTADALEALSYIGTQTILCGDLDYGD